MEFKFSGKVLTIAQENAWRAFEALERRLSELSSNERAEISIRLIHVAETTK